MSHSQDFPILVTTHPRIIKLSQRLPINIDFSSHAALPAFSKGQPVTTISFHDVAKGTLWLLPSPPILFPEKGCAHAQEGMEKGNRGSPL